MVRGGRAHHRLPRMGDRRNDQPWETPEPQESVAGDDPEDTRRLTATNPEQASIQRSREAAT
jgi:hypothetical protein